MEGDGGNSDDSLHDKGPVYSNVISNDGSSHGPMRMTLRAIASSIGALGMIGGDSVAWGLNIAIPEECATQFPTWVKDSDSAKGRPFILDEHGRVEGQPPEKATKKPNKRNARKLRNEEVATASGA